MRATYSNEIWNYERLELDNAVEKVICNGPSYVADSDGKMARAEEKLENLTEMMTRLLETLENELGPDKVAVVLGYNWKADPQR